jgi:hypothetical protein
VARDVGQPVAVLNAAVAGIAERPIEHPARHAVAADPRWRLCRTAHRTQVHERLPTMLCQPLQRAEFGQLWQIGGVCQGCNQDRAFFTNTKPWRRLNT